MITQTVQSTPAAVNIHPCWSSELSCLLSPASVARQNEPLAKRTTLRVGGPADLYVEPASEQDLARILSFCQERAIPVFVLGRGSNLLIRDGGFRGVVICLAHNFFSRIEADGESLRCGAGARLKEIAYEARRLSLTGLEFLEGIPGSLGGALRMNAGAMGAEIFEFVVAVRVMGPTGIVEELTPTQMAVAYRRCVLLKNHIALQALLAGRRGALTEIEARMNGFRKKRWTSQPAAPSAGCMFKNPLSIPAGKLIDELGLKGTRVGGARVSVEHANFIVNDGNATARDVCSLIKLIQDRARQERGLELETEVEIVGSDE